MVSKRFKGFAELSREGSGTRLFSPLWPNLTVLYLRVSRYKETEVAVSVLFPLGFPLCFPSMLCVYWNHHLQAAGGVCCGKRCPHGCASIIDLIFLSQLSLENAILACGVC